MAYDSNLGKQAVIYTVVLLLSWGLCGYSLSGANREYSGFAAIFSLLGLAVGFIGLLVTGINALTRRRKP